MSSNRQQLATGLKAILGGASGAVRDNPPPSSPAAPAAAPVVEVQRAPMLEAGGAAVSPAAEPAVAPAEAVREVAPVMPAGDAIQHVVALPAVSAAKATKAKRKPEPEPVFAQPGQRVGTLDRPYVRQRDNQPTRKVGVVLPVDLAERLQIHCVKTRTRPNAFVEQAILEALDRL